MSDVRLITWPLWQLIAAGVGLAMLPAVVLALLRRLLQRASEGAGTRAGSVPELNGGRGDSLFHRWEARVKIVTLMAYCFMIASLSRPETALAAILVSLLATLLARVSAARVLRRLLAIVGFVGMFLVVMPFTVADRPGDTIYLIHGLDWLGVNLRGLRLAATMAAKAVAVTLLMEPLLATAPLPVTLHALSRLGVPEMVAQMVLLSHRYLHVFGHEARRMASGMQVRGFRGRTDLKTLHALANFLGMLFVRSFERTERVFDAMRARGYKGRFPQPDAAPARPRDWILAAAVLALGTALLLFDRFGA